MPINILMPALSPTMEKGNLAKWLKKEGETVKPGDVIAEIETDKATMEIEAVDEGTLAKIVVPEGTADVPVNQLIAVLAAEGEDAKAAAGAASAASAPKPADVSKPATPQPAPSAPPSPSGGGISARAAQPHPSARSGEGGAAQVAPGGATNGHGRIFSSPLARRLAKDAGIDIARIAGSGPHGRVVARDIAAAREGKGLKAPAGAPVSGSAPAIQLPSDDKIRALYEEGSYEVIPNANVSWTESGMLKHKHSDVGVAVALPGGLITPIVRNAETKSLSAISNELKDMVARARARKLKPQEYQGGTTAVSNLGMYGIKDFTAVINPPHATILAAGAAQERPIVREGAIVAAHVMSVTLSCDHRAVDGALGAELIGAFKALIENPVMMVV